MRRRGAIAAAMVAALVAVAAVALPRPSGAPPRAIPVGAVPPLPATTAAPQHPDPGGDDNSGTLPAITPAVPGDARLVSRGPADSGAIALTFDDGYCDQCVAGLVAGVERTGAHVTFCPNGVYGPATWDLYASRIKALIAKGQVTICNHTWDHQDLTKINADQVRTELTKNEQWIESTFGVTSRPFFRPPYGRHNPTVDKVAAQLGYTDVLMWAGTLGDSNVQTPEFILNQMRLYAKAGFVVLAHGNHPATASMFDALVAVAVRAGLRLETVSELVKHPSPGSSTTVSPTTLAR